MLTLQYLGDSSLNISSRNKKIYSKYFKPSDLKLLEDISSFLFIRQNLDKIDSHENYLVVIFRLFKK